jgi:hypothetical protein
MLEDLIAAIHGCHLLYAEYADLPDTGGGDLDARIDAAFIRAVRDRAAKDHDRLS